MTEAEELAFNSALTRPFAESHLTVSYYVYNDPKLVYRAKNWVDNNIEEIRQHMKSSEYELMWKMRRANGYAN